MLLNVLIKPHYTSLQRSAIIVALNHQPIDLIRPYLFHLNSLRLSSPPFHQRARVHAIYIWDIYA